LPGADPGGFAQEARALGAERDHDTAHALHRTTRDRPVDRTGAGREIAARGIDDQVVEPAVDHAGHREAAAWERFDGDGDALHGARYPMPCRRFSVSVSGRPTTLDQEPPIQGMKPSARPWIA
jgi:hypothetical protein